MKVIITEQQSNRIMNMIKEFGGEFSDERVVHTEVNVEYHSKRKMYHITPIFYVKNKKTFPYSFYRHMLAQRIEDYIGAPVHSVNSFVEEVK
jgi:hypothetical protein